MQKERSVVFELCQNAFPTVALPRTPLASSRRSPDHWSVGEGTHLPVSHPTRRSILLTSALANRRLDIFWGGAFAPNIFVN